MARRSKEFSRRELVRLAGAGAAAITFARVAAPLRTPGRVGLARTSVPAPGAALTPQVARAAIEAALVAVSAA